ncbi:MAG: hypothetical protein DESF_01317 [Desulfovibrio sp.]
MPLPSGNRCGHDPHHPRLNAAVSIPKGKGGVPRILSLAAERAKAWYFHPAKCPALHGNGRQIRSERREACQIVLEVILRHLDLASMCLGAPTPASGFIDIDMGTIVRDSGLGQRRCERAIALLKEAGFMRVKQPRQQNEEGAYFGCRAIRIVTEALFEALGLGPMLHRERARASERLRRKAQKMNKKLSDLMNRLRGSFKSPSGQGFRLPFARTNESREQRTLAWNQKWGELVLQGVPPDKAQRQTNEILDYPLSYSPGQEYRRR